MALVTVSSGSSLNVTWAANTANIVLPQGAGPALSLAASGINRVLYSASNSNPSNSKSYGIDGYLIEYYASVPTYKVQVITTSSSAGLSEVQRITVDSDANNLAGFFKLEYQGVTTGKIKFNANADGDSSVAQALIRLSTVGAVEVTRDFSRRAVPGLLVNGTTGSYNVSVTSPASFASLVEGDYVWIGNTDLLLKVVTIDYGNGQIQFDQAITYRDFTETRLYKWSYGYVWDVTFIAQIGPLPLLIATTSDNWAGTNPVLKVDTVRKGVDPLSGTFRVGYKGVLTPPLPYAATAAEMKLALESLDTIGEVLVQRFRNGYGNDWRVTLISELNNAPSMYVNDAGLSGPYARAAVSNVKGGVAPLSYSSVFISGGAVTSAVITGLTLGTQYQVVVSAHNSEGYSYPLVSYPNFVAPKTQPSAPFNASFYALSDSRLKLSWNTPVNTGGAPIVMYRIEYDIASDFRNVPQNGNVREISVVPIEGSSTYCIDIEIAVASRTVPRYARLYSFNGYASSMVGYPTPRFAIGEIKAPGAPTSVYAYPTSATGILATWSAPNALDCVFGGDGGSTVTQYVIEWDIRPDFGSPAAQATTSDMVDLSFLIGGRDSSTGVLSTLLDPNTLYYVRVTAFNSKGASVAGNAASAVTTGDQPPNAPGNVTITHSTGKPTSLALTWSLPQRDGGATIEKYRLQYATEPFDSVMSSGYEVQDYAVVPEVQTVVASSGVINEFQALRALVAVTNERQIFRTKINGSDEVQTITTHCDDVTNEVQRFTTTATDINEVQTLEITGSDVNEIQLLRSHTVDIPSVQTLQITSNTVNEVQIIGVIIENINIPSSCSAGSSCSTVEAGFSGTFTLSFDPNACGTDASDDDSNWCVAALIEQGRTGYDCTGSYCISAAIALSDGAAAIQTKLCALTGSNTANYFLQDSDGTCGVTVADDSAVLYQDNFGAGVYKYAYTVTFTGTTVRGNVPKLRVETSSVVYSASLSATVWGSEYGTSPVYYVGDVHDGTTGFGYESVQGNQPSGTIFLIYTCESKTVPISITVSDSGARITITDSVPATLELYQYVRIQATYHKIIALPTGSTSVATISPAYHLSSATVSGGSELTQAEYGVFYSEPDADYGVSDNCAGNNRYTTAAISPIDTASNIQDKLKALSQVISQDSGSVVVTRNPFLSDSITIGYNWTITFLKQNGEVPILECVTTNLVGTNTVSGKFQTH
jgi:hypothetical protein